LKRFLHSFQVTDYKILSYIVKHKHNTFCKDFENNFTSCFRRYFRKLCKNYTIRYIRNVSQLSSIERQNKHRYNLNRLFFPRTIIIYKHVLSQTVVNVFLRSLLLDLNVFNQLLFIYMTFNDTCRLELKLIALIKHFI